MELTVKDIQTWLDNYSKVIEEKKDYLSELDTPIGDGDHGNNMARGMAEYKIAFDKKYQQQSRRHLKSYPWL